MKNKLIVFSTILVLSMLVAGGTFSWFTSSPEASLTNITLGTVEVEVISESISNMRVKSSGTSENYIRVRLVPSWSNSNLSVDNVTIETDNSWVEYKGYYYYSYSLLENEETTDLIQGINIDYTSLPPEYEGATFTLKIVAEGVQTAHEAWKDVWNITSLPF